MGDDEKIDKLIENLTYLKARDAELVRQHETLWNDRWPKLERAIHSNTDTIHKILQVTSKIDLLVEQIKTNAEQISKLQEVQIRQEPIPSRVSKLEAKVEDLFKWRWTILGGAFAVAFTVSLVEPIITKYLL